MINKVEILRAICFDKEDMKDITNIDNIFTDIEIELMIEFKKIYELGLEQLKKFIDMLDKEGEKLDVYTITYYVDILMFGPLNGYVRELSKDKKYFRTFPETMGAVAMFPSHTINTSIHPDSRYPINGGVDILNKLPSYMTRGFIDAAKQVEDVFRTSFESTYAIDNTLPLVDKKQQTRYETEPSGGWVETAHGTYMVKDSKYYLTIQSISESIFDKLKEQLGKEHYRIYDEKKFYNAFGDKNLSKSGNSVLEKKIIEFRGTENEREQIIQLDLFGDDFDSIEKRAYKVKIETDGEDKEYKLNTVLGQLGEGEKSS